MPGLFQRITDKQRSEIAISIDGDQLRVLDGDTVLTAILLHHDHLRVSEVGEESRAGFCLMGACQDCWVSDADGQRFRACTTYVQPGLAIVTGRRGNPGTNHLPQSQASSDQSGEAVAVARFDDAALKTEMTTDTPDADAVRAAGAITSSADAEEGRS